MKKSFLGYIVPVLFILLPCGKSALAQVTNYPLASGSKLFLEYMSELAWQNNPENDNLYQKTVIAQEEIKLAKRGWYRDLTASFNLNEGNIRSTSGDTDISIARSESINGGPVTLYQSRTITKGANDANLFFPRYNFNATFNIGAILDTKNNTRIAEKQLTMAENSMEQRKLDLRRELQTLYQEYLASIEILKVRTNASDEAKTSHKLISELFRQGDDNITFEDYNQASVTYYDSQEAMVEAQTNFTLSKYSLENMIGVRLEQVEANFKGK